MRTYLFLSLAVVLLTAACTKDGPEADLPATTQEGKNTAGFLLNGQPWLPKGSILGTNPSGINATWTPNSLHPNLTFGFGRYNDGDITSFGFYIPKSKIGSTIDLDLISTLLRRIQLAVMQRICAH